MVGGDLQHFIVSSGSLVFVFTPKNLGFLCMYIGFFARQKRQKITLIFRIMKTVSAWFGLMIFHGSMFKEIWQTIEDYVKTQ